MSTERARHGSVYFPRRRRVLLGGVCALVVGLALGPLPAAAKTPAGHKPPHKETGHVSKEPFGDIPKGPLQIIVSINQQKLHVYSDGVHIADTSVATGVPSLPTPTGVFSVIQKQIFHRSNIYSNAPMPFMQRITWSGVAMHEGENIGHPASHGCIRMPREFAARLYTLTRLGVRVIVARSELKPVVFADPHLFVHKDKAPDQAAAAPVATETVKTAQTIDASKKTDAVDAPRIETPATDAAEAPKTETSTTAAVEAPKTEAPPAAGGNEAAATAIPPQAAPDKTAAAAESVTNDLRGTQADPAVRPAVPEQAVPVPLTKPAAIAVTGHGQIAIFVSRKEKKIFVRQNFTPLFDAPVTIAHPELPFGTHVFTAMEYLDDGATFRWNVVSFPGESPKAGRKADSDMKLDRHFNGKRKEELADKTAAEPPPPPQLPDEVLARIEIPQEAIDRISALMVPGSSLIVSDQGLGDETGEGTDFVVVTR